MPDYLVIHWSSDTPGKQKIVQGDHIRNVLMAQCRGAGWEIQRHGEGRMSGAKGSEVVEVRVVK